MSNNAIVVSGLVALHEVLAKLNHHDLQLGLALLHILLAVYPLLRQDALLFFNFGAQVLEGASLLFQHRLALAIVSVKFTVQLLDLLS